MFYFEQNTISERMLKLEVMVNVKKLIRLMIGFIFCAFGIVLSINANLGLAPWDVLHQGVSKLTGITMGQASIIIGIIVILADIILGENLGWGTILNMIIIGWLMDLFMFSGLIPQANNLLMGIIMIIAGMISMGIGCYLYIGAGLGSGARDGMMVAIQKRTSKPVSLVRMSIEICALIIGYMLGGTVGIGTIISGVGLGYCIQIVFKTLKFNVAGVTHRYIHNDIKLIKEKIKAN